MATATSRSSWLAAALFTAGASACVGAPAPSACQIGDTIYPGGASNPTNPCETCQPAVDPLAWSVVIGMACDAGPSSTGGHGAGGPGNPGTDAGPAGDAGPAEDAGPDRGLEAFESYGSNIYSEVASGDLDGDGRLDLAAVGYHDRGLDLFLGQAGGALSGLTHYDGADGFGVAIADLNGDGFADVVATNAGVSVYLNQRDGSLLPGGDYATSNVAVGVGLGDVNGDGYPDLVVGERRGAELFLNNGDGTFGPPTTLAASGGSWAGVVVVDLNRDGLADIAIGGQLLNTPTDDAWTVLLSLPGGGFEGTAYPGSGGGIAVLDARHDGAPDLATGSWVGNTLSVFRNSGEGHFGPAESYSVESLVGLAWLIAGDFNGDQVPDLATCSWSGSQGGLFVLYGSPRGGFDAPQTLKSGAITPSGLALLGPVNDPRDLAVAAGTNKGIWVLGDR